MNLSQHIDQLDSYSEKLKLIGRPLLNFACSRIFNNDHAQDVVQDTLLILCQKRNEYDPNKSFHAWAFRICKFQILKYFTNRKRNKEDCREDFDSLIEEIVEESMESISEEYVVEMLKNNLPPQQNQVFCHVLKGLPRKEICSLMNMREQTLNQNYRRLIINSKKILSKIEKV
jgi:RNA polymerase sigma-70 factor (ECF subfamily)|tara:strand:+ start:40030 stop:40548 length:519 start_codon:yes stop_codon:yes gene_type:complete